MHPMSKRGGSSAPAGVYREMHSGRLVYLDTTGTLPGQSNSEVYIQVPAAALLSQRRPATRVIAAAKIDLGFQPA